MTSKLSQYAEGVIEASWLVAIIIVPVFFNVYSSRIFEPDKIALLRTLSLIVLAAWLIKTIEEGGIQFTRRHYSNTLYETLRNTPIILPVIALFCVYLISTILSITPRTSLFGSYQRLQGFYTFLSYIVLFSAIVVNLRKREQINRIVNAIVLSSLPVALYGVIQRYGLDPIPWGGNVTNRIASNMGNSIFIAAYLIMVFPLTIGKIISSFRGLLADQSGLARNITRATFFIFIAIMQLIGIYLSGSRGPLLGMIASVVVIFILLSVHWRLRWLLFTTILVGIGVVAFLGVLNIPNGPLENLRDASWIGRFGQIFNTEERTSQVRALIWEGAAELAFPHEPIVFPDGSTDKLNLIRPLIGYGLEGMYVAYNPFYPPELAKIEKRNASPDRSHNETWDAIVMTGALGLVVYLGLFGAIFNFGLRWLGLINNRKQHIMLFAFMAAGGLIGGIALYFWQGIGFVGIGLPFGIIAGLIAYLVFIVVISNSDQLTTKIPTEQAVLLSVLLGAIIGHFVEIHFGIAIVSTRTYFWVYTALLVLAGYILPRDGVFGSLESETGASTPDSTEVQTDLGASKTRRRKGRGYSANQTGLSSIRWRHLFIAALIPSVILITLGYNFVSNLERSTSGIDIFWKSLTWLPNDDISSFGIFAMVIFTWLTASIVVGIETNGNNSNTDWLKNIFFISVFSGIIGFGYWLIQSFLLAGLASIIPTNQQEVLGQINGFANLLTIFYVVIVMVILIFSAFFPDKYQRKNSVGVGSILAPIIILIVFYLGYTTNLKIIHGDITFKMADSFTRENQWPISILVYRHAIDLVPNEDHYYLFLGRAYLEYAKSLGDPLERNALMQQAEQDLLKAQKSNPLNTDHTANLARLYSWWASTSSDAIEKEKYISLSEGYYDKAVTLSPNNVVLWGEKAILELSLLKDKEKAIDTLTIAMEVDSEYDRTHALFGDYYVQESRLNEGDTRSNLLRQAAEQYELAISYVPKPKENNATRYTYAIALGGVYLELDETEKAIDTYLFATEFALRKDKWRVFETLSRLYVQIDEKDSAILSAQSALEFAPESEQERLNTYLAQLKNSP